tara:strand:+ start:139 stop:378 length:240 start_codon:yes stop_codon:yes gene_type:complete
MYDLTIDDIELFLELMTVDLLTASMIGPAADLIELFLEPETLDIELFLACASCELFLAPNDLELFLAFFSFDEPFLELL